MRNIEGRVKNRGAGHTEPQKLYDISKKNSELKEKFQ